MTEEEHAGGLFDTAKDARTCYIADPEGNLIEIGSFVKSVP